MLAKLIALLTLKPTIGSIAGHKNSALSVFDKAIAKLDKAYAAVNKFKDEAQKELAKLEDKKAKVNQSVGECGLQEAQIIEVRNNIKKITGR